MDFIFMLTRHDRTVARCLDYVGAAQRAGVRHLGFKDVGIDPGVMRALSRRIQAAGATSYMEVVSTIPERCLAAARTAVAIGVDCLLGGTRAEDMLAVLAGSGVAYYPFPGRPRGHPTALYGTAEDIAADTARLRALGCAGVDLLAYRAREADPMALVRAARAASDGRLIVAGSVGSAERIRALAGAGADAFTVGSAVFDGAFASSPDIVAQLEAIQAACR